eukprot:2403840-Amphidinium_carterae.1
MRAAQLLHLALSDAFAMDCLCERMLVFRTSVQDPQKHRKKTNAKKNEVKQMVKTNGKDD